MKWFGLLIGGGLAVFLCLLPPSLGERTAQEGKALPEVAGFPDINPAWVQAFYRLTSGELAPLPADDSRFEATRALLEDTLLLARYAEQRGLASAPENALDAYLERQRMLAGLSIKALRMQSRDHRGIENLRQAYLRHIGIKTTYRMQVLLVKNRKNAWLHYERAKKEPALFAGLVKRHSAHFSRNLSEALYVLSTDSPQGEKEARILARATGLRNGEISKPFRLGGGWAIIRLKSAERNLPLSPRQQKEAIERFLFEQSLQETLDAMRAGTVATILEEPRRDKEESSGSLAGITCSLLDEDCTTAGFSEDDTR